MNRMSMLVGLVIATTALAVSTGTEARCRLSYVCDDYGENCEYRDVCDSVLDLPSVDLPPLSALPSLELKPLPSLELPLLGTSQCEYKLVNGQWQNVCR